GLEKQESLLRLIRLAHFTHGAERQLIETRQLNVLAVESVVKLVWILLYSHLCASNKTIIVCLKNKKFKNWGGGDTQNHHPPSGGLFIRRGHPTRQGLPTPQGSAPLPRQAPAPGQAPLPRQAQAGLRFSRLHLILVALIDVRVHKGFDRDLHADH